MMKNTIECPNCFKLIRYENKGNHIIFCDECLKKAYIENEYGFGDIIPTFIYLGDKEIGNIQKEDNEFVLSYDNKKKILNNDRSKIIEEAINIIEEYLNDSKA